MLGTTAFLSEKTVTHPSQTLHKEVFLYMDVLYQCMGFANFIDFFYG